jgi:hypothetical protein
MSGEKASVSEVSELVERVRRLRARFDEFRGRL